MESRTPAKIADLSTITAWQNPATGEIRVLDAAPIAAMAESAKDTKVDTKAVTATAYQPDAKSPAKVMPVFERAVMAKDAAAVDFKPRNTKAEDAGNVILFGLDEVVLAGQKFRVDRVGHETMKDPVTGEELLRMELVRI
jgi:hypothetical protein